MGIERPEGPYATEMTAGAAWVWADENSYFGRADELTGTLTQLNGARETWEQHRNQLFGGDGVWSGQAAEAAAAEVDSHTQSMHTLQEHLRVATKQASTTGGAIVDAKNEVIANVVQAQGIIEQINALDTDDDVTGLIQQVVLATYTNNVGVVATAAAGLQAPASVQTGAPVSAPKASGASQALASKAQTTQVARAPVEPKKSGGDKDGTGTDGKGKEAKGGLVKAEDKDGKYGKEWKRSFGKGGTTTITTQGDVVKQAGTPTNPHEWKPTKTGQYQVNMGKGEWSLSGPGRQGEAYMRQTTDGISGKAGVSAWGAKASGNLVSDVGGRPLTVEGNAFAGGKAELSGALTDHGVSLGGEAFAGAQADVTGKYKIGPFDLSLGASAQAGIGGSAHFDVGLQDGKAVFGGDLGAAVGLGGKISPHIEIDYRSVFNSLSHADDWLEGLFD